MQMDHHPNMHQIYLKKKNILIKIDMHAKMTNEIKC